MESFHRELSTYEVLGTTLTVRPLVAKVPNAMSDNSFTYTCRVEGDTLRLTLSAAWEEVRFGTHSPAVGRRAESATSTAGVLVLAGAEYKQPRASQRRSGFFPCAGATTAGRTCGPSYRASSSRL